jgi:hypothetical protein
MNVAQWVIDDVNLNAALVGQPHCEHRKGLRLGLPVLFVNRADNRD